MEKIVLLIYIFCLSFILIYSLGQLHLVLLYLRKRRLVKKLPLLDVVNEGEVPFVTVQLPIYNELYVVERLIDAVAQFEYPKSRFEIQVLDDSTDETIEIIAQKVAEVQARYGVQIAHIRRPERKGFKAGALAYGLTIAKGEFVAIFDADFLPAPDFLKQTIPFFNHDRIGVVQTRWEHINASYSLLTELQALALDAHFSIEQLGRNMGGHFMNFNGTAGLWRKACIEDAGGWQSDTLTEDLDLSYRAQLKGWEFRYLPFIGTPAELPVAMNALKSQQFRWTKGAAECARKNLGKVLLDGKLSAGSKFHALFHLLNSSIFICVFLMSVLSVPLLLVMRYFPEYHKWFDLVTYLGGSILIVVFFFWVAYRQSRTFSWGMLGNFIMKFPLFLSVSMGLALHNGLAVLEGYIGKKTPFIRTPKFNVKKDGDQWKSNKYLKTKIGLLTWIEIGLAFYFLAAILLGAYYKDGSLFIFHSMLFIGYTIVGYYSVQHAKGVGFSK